MMSFGFGFGTSLWWSGLISHFVTYNFICRFICGIPLSPRHTPWHKETQSWEMAHTSNWVLTLTGERSCTSKYLLPKGLVWQSVSRILILTSYSMNMCVCDCAYSCACLTTPCSMSFSYFVWHHLFIIIFTAAHEKAYPQTWNYFTILYSFHLDLHICWEWSVHFGNISIDRKWMSFGILIRWGDS